MLETINKTPFAADLAGRTEKNGSDAVVCVVKATFSIADEALEIAELQEPLVWADQYYGDPVTTSLKYASEMTLPKPGTDIVMLGHAYGRGKPRTNVTLKVGSILKTVAVFGDRYWKGLLSLESRSRPKSFHKIPLIYENAYGGWDAPKSKPEKRRTYPFNPAGTGFFISGGQIKINGLKLPNIEHARHLLKGPHGRVKPEGFGYIAPHWFPRAGYAGTYDDQWKKTRMPYLPDNFDPKFYNAAHPDLIARPYLKGGESVAIQNADPGGILRFKLPSLAFEIAFNLAGKQIITRPNLDTLILEPDQKRFMMIYRSAIGCDKQLFQVSTATVRQVEAPQ